MTDGAELRRASDTPTPVLITDSTCAKCNGRGFTVAVGMAIRLEACPCLRMIDPSAGEAPSSP